MADEPGPGDRAGATPGALVDVEVVGFDRTGSGFAELDSLVDLARTTLIREGLAAGRLDLVAVDPDEMAELNRTHLGHDGPTDVLSFPLDADHAIDGFDADLDLDLDPAVGVGPDDVDGAPPLHLGDVIVCPEVARRQAPGHTGSEGAELCLLVIHGVLHVLGHDHAEPAETSAMQARERHHLAAIGHRHPADREAPC